MTSRLDRSWRRSAAGAVMLSAAAPLALPGGAQALPGMPATPTGAQALPAAHPAPPLPLPPLLASITAAPSALTPISYRLWAGRAPMAQSDSAAETPTLTVYRPQISKPGSPAVIVMPGGGYIGLAPVIEGRDPASWLTARGVTAFVLTYRVAKVGRLPVPLLDGARAVRFVRAHAAELRIDPASIGVMGFSAGGHLAASIATAPPSSAAVDADAIDQVSARPDFAVLIYPWLEATRRASDGSSPFCTFAKFQKGATCDPKAYERYSPIAQVNAATPPTFLFHTGDDAVVPFDGTLRFFQALRDNKVPAELHVFESGAHGSGLGGADDALSHWPELLDLWLRRRGTLRPGD